MFNIPNHSVFTTPHSARLPRAIRPARPILSHEAGGLGGQALRILNSTFSILNYSNDFLWIAFFHSGYLYRNLVFIH